MAKLAAGDKAPAFTLTDQDGKKVSLKDFAGQQVVVYFYPRDDTPGCTKEACQFNDNLRAFARADVAVIGISPDGAEKHVKFRTKYGLKFPLLSDPGQDVYKRQVLDDDPGRATGGGRRHGREDAQGVATTRKDSARRPSGRPAARAPADNHSRSRSSRPCPSPTWLR